jgi:acyl dehydratase
LAEQIEITEEMRAVIGKGSPPWTHEVTTTSVRAFARGVGYTDPVYYDIDAARKAGYRNLPAPPTYLGTPIFIPKRSSDTFSGPVEDGPRLQHGLKNVLDGGAETEYFGSICAGDTLTVVRKVTDLAVRKSRSLGQMLIVTNETTYTNHDEEVVAKQQSQAIFY